MTDYHSPTVLTPHVPFGDVTSLEAILLPLLFDHSWCEPSDVITVEIDAVRKDLDESRSVESRISAYVITLLAGHEAIPEEVRPDGLGGQDTRGRIEAIAASTGWDSFTLLPLIAQWLDRSRLTDALVEHLAQLASSEEG